MVFSILQGPWLRRWPWRAALPAAAPGGAALVPRQAAHAGAAEAMDVGGLAAKMAVIRGKTMEKVWENHHF